MQGWIDFASGPLFRLAFILMVLGLLRTFLFSTVGLVRAYRRGGDRDVPWGQLARKTVSWFLPANRLWRSRPIYSTISFIWHIGLIIVPLFLVAHVTLWRESTGFSWFAIPQPVADVLTWLTIAAAIALFIGRAGDRNARALSRRQDFVWPLLLTVPFVTGAICAQIPVSPGVYQAMMLTHLLSASLVMIMIPFTKVAHCVLLPLSQFVSGVGWKFPKAAGERVAVTLGHPTIPTVTTDFPLPEEQTVENEPAREEVPA